MVYGIFVNKEQPMKNLAQLADRIANQMYCDHTTHWEVIRSLVDLKTGGDLETSGRLSVEGGQYIPQPPFG
jgi:hypothetical protein